MLDTRVEQILSDSYARSCHVQNTALPALLLYHGSAHQASMDQTSVYQSTHMYDFPRN